MELKLDWPIYELLPCCLLIAPLMELKFGFGFFEYSVVSPFNRTAYGIEICVLHICTVSVNLLIAPLMELKLLRS